MKTNALKGLFLLLFLCLLSCGGKAQKNHNAADSAQQQKTDTLAFGASGFPEYIKKAWRVSLQDSMVYVAFLNTSEKDSEVQMYYGPFPCEVFHYENGKWKNTTTQLVSPERHYKKKEASTSYPFDFLEESDPDDPRRIYPLPEPETELEGYDLADVRRLLRPNETALFSISLYNGRTRSIEKGLYRLTFCINGKTCYIVFEL